MKNYLFLTFLLLATSTALYAQTGKTKTDSTKQQTYTCPMHPEVISHQPGKCPKCGMTLEQVKKPQSLGYTCPMHPEVTSKQPGKCPKCGMNLVEKMGSQSMDSTKHKMAM